MTQPNTNAAWQARKSDAIARGEGNLADLSEDSYFSFLCKTA